MATNITTDKWEAAWEAYVDAQEAYDESRPYADAFTRGWLRKHRGNRCRLRDAIVRLRKLDADFCDRMGITSVQSCTNPTPNPKQRRI